MIAVERKNIESFLHSKLCRFVDYLASFYNCQSSERSGDYSIYYQSLVDEVNSELLSRFDCLEDYKLVTLVTSFTLNGEDSGVTNAAVWSNETDLVISTECTDGFFLYHLSTHLVRINTEDYDD